MKAYWVCIYDVINDEEKLKEYAKNQPYPNIDN